MWYEAGLFFVYENITHIWMVSMRVYTFHRSICFIAILLASQLQQTMGMPYEGSIFLSSWIWNNPCKMKYLNINLCPYWLIMNIQFASEHLFILQIGNMQSENSPCSIHRTIACNNMFCFITLTVKHCLPIAE